MSENTSNQTISIPIGVWSDLLGDVALRDSLPRILSDAATRIATGNCLKDSKDYGFSSGRAVELAMKQGNHRVTLRLSIYAEIDRPESETSDPQSASDDKDPDPQAAA